MRLIKIIIAGFVLLLAAESLTAQTDSSNKKADSINVAILNDYNKKISLIEEQRIADSLKKTELEAQLNSLKTTDNLKKEELQKQLQFLKDKDAIRVANKKGQNDSLRQTAKGFPVMGLFQDTLFLIYSKLGSFSAKDRAEAISNRISKLTDVFRFRADSLQSVESESTVDIVFNEKIIMSVAENDALWNNTTKPELATKYKKIIGDEIVQYNVETSFSTLAKEIGLTLLVIVVVVFLIKYIIKFFKWTALQVHRQENKRIKGIQVKNYTLFNAKQQVNALQNINTVLKWLIIFLAIYIALPILFGIFPWTRNFADTLFGYILNPVKKILNGFWNYLPNLITIIVIIFVFRYVLKAIHFLKIEIEKGDLDIKGFYPDWAAPTYQIVRVLLL